MELSGRDSSETMIGPDASGQQHSQKISLADLSGFAIHHAVSSSAERGSKQLRFSQRSGRLTRSSFSFTPLLSSKSSYESFLLPFLATTTPSFTENGSIDEANVEFLVETKSGGKIGWKEEKD